jgi:preprotein translocase subunit SecF
MNLMSLSDLYEKMQKPLTISTLLILVFAVIIIAGNMASYGFFMERDVELTGGKRVSFIVEDTDVSRIEAALPEENVKLYRGTINSLVISMPYDADEAKTIEIVRKEASVIGDPTIEEIGPVIGGVFWQQAQAAFLIAFVLMSIIVFILFRSPVPSLIVILSAVTDIAGTVAVISLLGIQLSLGVLAALIMVLAYSIDTDVLLTSSVLKQKNKRIINTMKTGITMSLTTFSAVLALYLLTGSALLQNMALVIMTGVLIDIPVTWFTNAGLLKMWTNREEKKND